MKDAVKIPARVREQRDTEIGLEVQCSCCREFWPADRDFYFMHSGRPHSWCKACYRANFKGGQPPPATPLDWAPLQEAFCRQPDPSNNVHGLFSRLLPAPTGARNEQ